MVLLLVWMLFPVRTALLRGGAMRSVSVVGGVAVPCRLLAAESEGSEGRLTTRERAMGFRATTDPSTPIPLPPTDTQELPPRVLLRDDSPAGSSWRATGCCCCCF